MRPIFFITVAFALVVASAPNARADMCFRYSASGGGVYVAQADLPTAPNKCITLSLYEPLQSGGLLGAGTGTLCTSSGGTFVVFNYVYHNCLALGPSSPFNVDGDSYFESATCQARLSQSGGTVGILPTTNPSVCRGTVIRGKLGQAGAVGAFFNHDDLKIEKCDSNAPQFVVPTGGGTDCFYGTEKSRQSPEQPSPGSEQPSQAAPKR